MPYHRLALIAILTSTVCGNLSSQESKAVSSERTPLELFWEGGLRAESKDGRFKLRLRTRLENDWGFIDAGNAIEKRLGSLSDGTELRRMRIGLQGQIYEDISFKAQVDFASGDAEFRSVYAGISQVPFLGNIRIGNQREPFGLERNTGTHYISMMERASSTALAPKRNTGILAHNHHCDERLTWAIGTFRETNDQGFGQGNGELIGTARITGIPWLADSSHFLHLGVSMSHREFGDKGTQFKARPGLHLAPSFADTANIAADDGSLTGVEALWMMGSTALQIECMQARVNNLKFQGSYAQVSHFLNGDRRRFRRAFPQFIRVNPNNNDGAWELTARVSTIDLNDAAVQGGQMTDYTLGLNWYANPNVRVMANLIYVDLDEPGDPLMFAMRFGIDF
jgi:phosphate-selective porin OprO/OprP